jgi:hypothetical protein
LKKFIISVVAWELITACFAVALMLTFGKSFNAENTRKLLAAALIGLFVVFLCWIISRRFERHALGWGALIGFIAPPSLAWLLATSFPLPYWISPLEVQSLGVVLSVPSAVAAAVASFILVKDLRPKT